MNKERPALSDKEIVDAISSIKKPYELTLYIFFALLGGVAVSVFFAWNMGIAKDSFQLVAGIGIFIVVILAIVLLSMRTSAVKKLKSFIAENLIAKYLDDTFDSYSYKHEARLGDDILRANMHINRRIDEIKGSDYIEGVYKGLELEMSDVSLTEITVTRDKDGKRRERRDTFFKGLWCVCDFKKGLSSDLWVTEKNAFINFDFGLVKTDNVAFNKRFAVRTDNELEAFYVLTPHMMEYIEEMDRVANAKTYMRFLQDGRVYIALNSNRDSFEFGLGSDIAKIRAIIRQDLDYITAMLDEIMSSSYYRK